MNPKNMISDKSQPNLNLTACIINKRMVYWGLRFYSDVFISSSLNPSAAVFSGKESKRQSQSWTQK